MISVPIFLVYFIVLGKNPQNLQRESERETAGWGGELGSDGETHRARAREQMTSQNRYLQTETCLLNT